MLQEIASSVKTHVRKDGRNWQTVNGDGQPVEHGRGLAGWRNAMLAALTHDQPELNRAVESLWRQNGCSVHLMDRLIKAAVLVAKGKIFLVERNDNGSASVTRVESQHRAREYYTVTWNGYPKKYTCTCLDYNGDAPYLPDLGQRACKHVLATHLVALLGRDLPPEPIPFMGEPVVYK